MKSKSEHYGKLSERSFFISEYLRGLMPEYRLDSIRRTHLLIGLYLLTVISILVVEKFQIGSHVFSLVKANQNTPFTDFLFQNGKAISRTATLSIVIFLVLTFSRAKLYVERYLATYKPSIAFNLPLQIGFFLAFYFTAPVALTTSSENANPLLAQALWLALGVATACFTLLALAHFRFWQTLLANEKWKIIFAVVLATGVWWFSQITQHLWTAMSEITFVLVANILDFFHNDIYLDMAEKHIGLGNFVVDIEPACSGYEGIGLITAFTAVYLFSFRKDFKFPVAFLLFPIGAVIIWLFNVVRIISLIMIGNYWSKEVAVWGFHTQAGWITFIITSVLVMWMAHSSRFFTNKTMANKASSINLPMATLLPLIALLFMTFVTQALSGEFDWLYPLRVIVTGATIIYCLRYLDLLPLKISYLSVVAGVAVAIIWLWLVGVNEETDYLFFSVFTESGTVLVVTWLIFRFIGSVITVPIAEELGFRAYFLCRLASREVVTRGNIPFSLIAFAGTSLVFGILHNAWLAGTLAGMIYALVRYRSQHIMDAIVAHGITNMLLFFYAVYSGHWSVL